MPDSRTAIVLDDHPMVASGIAQFLQAVHPELQVVCVHSGAQLARLLGEQPDPAILVADVWLADANSLTSMNAWRSAGLACPWLAISGDDDPQVQQRARSAGAQGFVHKQCPPEQFREAFDAVLQGRDWFTHAPPAMPAAAGSREWAVTPDELGLTRRQGEILEMVLKGQPNKRIALNLGLSESTVKEHLTAILAKLGVRTRLEVLARLRGRRLVLQA